MNRIFLVDYENVSEYGLDGIFDIGCNDSAFVFYTKANNRISFDFLEKFRSDCKNISIRFLKAASGKNALDFQLSSFLGTLIEKNGIDEYEYIIVSKDAGFLCLATFWGRERPGIKILFASSIAKIINGGKAPLLDISKSEIGLQNTDSNENVSLTITAQPKQNTEQEIKQLNGQTRSTLNDTIQKKLSVAKYDPKTVSEISSFVCKAYRENKSKKEIYTWFIKTYKRNKGLEIYNVIKPTLY